MQGAAQGLPVETNIPDNIHIPTSQFILKNPMVFEKANISA